VLLAFAGSALLMGQSYEASAAYLVGDLLSLLAGALYTGYVLMMQRVRGDIGPWSALAISSAAGIPVLLGTALLFGEAILPHNWTPLIVLALMSQLVGQGLLIWALPRFSPLVVGLTLLVQPVVAATAGWLIFGETLSVMELFGGAMVAQHPSAATLPADPTLDEIRAALAPLVAASAAFDGFTAATLDEAADALGVDRDVARLAFPGGARDMVDAWFATIDTAMAERCPAETLATMKIRERITRLVETRIDLLAANRDLAAVDQRLLEFGTRLQTVLRRRFELPLRVCHTRVPLRIF